MDCHRDFMSTAELFSQESLSQEHVLDKPTYPLIEFVKSIVSNKTHLKFLFQ